MEYFAYGSNMNREQMKERCPDSVLIGKAVLSNYKIAFTIFSKKRNCGCADIIPSDGDEVWGLLYKISPEDLKKLDREEGHPKHYKRFQVFVTNEHGKDYFVETYEVAAKEGEFLKPSKHYLGLMRETASRFNFPEAYQSLLSRVETSG